MAQKDDFVAVGASQGGSPTGINMNDLFLCISHFSQKAGVFTAADGCPTGIIMNGLGI